MQSKSVQARPVRSELMQSDWRADLTASETDRTYNTRYLDPADINVVAGYGIEVFSYGLNEPVNMLFTESGNLIVAETGEVSGDPRVLQMVNNNFEVIAEGFDQAITGVNYLDGFLYVSHRGRVLRVSRNGVKQDIITGLPSNGDHYNGKVVFSADRRKLYFGQGTATNSGVVGQDNVWVMEHPILCDYPGEYITLIGQNFETRDDSNQVAPGEIVQTGAFSPYGIPNLPYETRKAYVKASGSVLVANIDGTSLEIYSWGFRNPLNLGFNDSGQLYVANRGYDNRGSRPIANAPDEFFAVNPDLWYGWPDYSGGNPVTLPRFTPEGRKSPELLLESLPNVPLEPFVTFPSSSNIMGFAFDYTNFGTYGDVYITEYGSVDFERSHESVSYAGVGHRVSKIDMKTRTVSTFAINKSGFPTHISQEGGFGRPVDIAFGPDQAMYVLDMGIADSENPNLILPYTGVIWRIYKL